MTSFKVNKVFTISNRTCVYLQGDIESGEIHVNDTLVLTFNPSFGMEGVISSIEYSDGPDKTSVCIGIECEDSEEQQFWLDMNIGEGEVVTINCNT